MIPLIPGQVGIPLVLRLAEVGQDLLVGPAGITELGPLVEVPLVAPDVEHRVEDRAAAQDLAAGPAAALVLHRLAGRRLWLSP